MMSLSSTPQTLLHSTSDTPGYWARVSQRRASNPDRSVWVNASAGTGKTKVLIERVLRLLLPRENGTPGTRPHRILCLTYTKAAASEMTERLLARVSEWAVMSNDALSASLHDMLDAMPRDDQMNAARRLFTQLIDGPDQVRILTLHAFCQSVLSRFPIEAGIAPHFTLIEGADVEKMLQTARQNVDIKWARDPNYNTILNDIAGQLSDFRLGQLMTELLSERRQILSAFEKYDATARADVYRQMFNLNPDDTIDTWAASIEHIPQSFIHDLILLDQGLSKGTKTEMRLADRIRDFTMRHPRDRAAHFDDICDVFFDKKGARSNDGGRYGARKAHDDLRLLYLACGDEIETFKRKRNMIDLYHMNIAVMTWMDEIINEYARLKRGSGVLDFDDLIRKTIALLNADQAHMNQTDTPSWVMYKLDGGIDHILLDEAQDTNPEQWQIMAALTRAFGPDEDARARRLFIVGDQKQSIYRFQGADPDTFEKMLHHFETSSVDVSKNNTQALDRIPMNTSFRSTAPILTLVDHVFKNDRAVTDLRLSSPPTHIVHRVGQGGRVEIWPIIPIVKDTDARAPWTPPVHIKPHTDGPTILARYIADKIHDWITSKKILPSHNRAVEPRDIMILVRKRAPYLNAIRAALHIKGIPVAAPDRQPILGSLAVKDLVALAQFALLPDDDLSLACFLKSPLCGGTDDDLIDMAATRTGSLWNNIKTHIPDHPWVPYLKKAIDQAAHQSPHTFFTDILDQPCPTQPNGSGRAALWRALSVDHTGGIDDLSGLAQTASENGQTLNHFIHTLIRDNPDIRQNTAPTDNVVRLMTVHGSKGLESPIVILPDTIKSIRDGRPAMIFWPDDTGAPLPIFVPRAGDRPDDIPNVIDRVRAADRSEEQRLLYVALTRAQDWLIVAGAERAQRVENTWYDTVLNGIQDCAVLPGYKTEDRDIGTVHIFECTQTAAPDRARLNATGAQNDLKPSTIPVMAALDLLKTPLKTEPTPSRPYRADRASFAPTPTSPLTAAPDPTRFARGLITHKLLEILPHLPAETWDATIQSFLSRRSTKIPEHLHIDIARDVLKILREPNFKMLFSKHSRAEVPITGMLNDGRLRTGKIDRLVITDTNIYILDYKTGPVVPHTRADIPAAYIDQIAVYQDLLRAIYPTHVIRCYLLWTTGPVLMEVTNAL